MKLMILLGLVTVTCVVVLQSTPSYCIIETLRPSAKGKIQPLFLNVSYHEETRVTTYNGRFAGPSDLVAVSVGTLQKVSDGANSSEFEIFAQFTYDHNYRRFILRSESASETLKMILNNSPANNVQTVFGGTRCLLEVKRSRIKDIETYSSTVADCGRDADYDISHYFGGEIDKDDNAKVSLAYVPESQIGVLGKYLNITENYTQRGESNITLNKITMMEDNIQLNALYFDVFALGLKPLGRRGVSEAILWRFHII